MAGLKGLAKLLGLSEDAAKALSKESATVLKAVDTPEKAAKLTGDSRATYLKALDEAYGDTAKRSADMGFGPETWYHGTSADIKEFNPSLGSASTKSKDSTKGMFFSSSPKTASTYADMASDSAVTEYLPEIKRLQDQLARVHDSNPRERDAIFNEIYRLQSKANDLVREKKLVPVDLGDGAMEPMMMDHLARQNIIPARLKIKDPLVSDEMGRYWDEKRTSNLLDSVNDNNKDGLILRNTTDDAVTDMENLGMAAPSDVAVVTNPSQIRSKFAAFDPRFAKSGSLVAGAAAMPNDLKPSDNMTIAKLKAYLENPSVALENLKRAGKMTEGDEIDAARKAITAFNPEANPSDAEIMQQVQDNRMVRDSAEGFVGGGIAKVADAIAGTSKMSKLKEVLEGKTTRESLNKPGAAIPEEFGSRADIIRRANEVAKSSTVDAARNSSLQRIQDMKSLSPEDATQVVPGDFTQFMRGLPDSSENYQKALRNIRGSIDDMYGELPLPSPKSRIKSYEEGAVDDLWPGKAPNSKEFKSQALVSKGGVERPRVYQESANKSQATADRKMTQRLGKDARTARLMDMPEDQLRQVEEALREADGINVRRLYELEDMAQSPDRLAGAIRANPLKDLGTGKLPKLREALKGKK